MSAVAFVINHIDVVLVVPILSCVVTFTLLKIMRIPHLPHTLIIIALTLPLALAYTIAFVSMDHGNADITDEVSRRLMLLFLFSPQVLVFWIVGVRALVRFKEGIDLKPKAVLFTLLLIAAGHYWTRTALSAL